MTSWWEAIPALIVILKPVLVPLGAFLAGWFFPSPLQKAKKGTEDVANSEKQGEQDTSKLDKLP